MARGPPDIVLLFPAVGLIKMQFHVCGESNSKEMEGGRMKDRKKEKREVS